MTPPAPARWRALRLLGSLAAACLAAAAGAAPVWVSQGDARGQGHVFALRTGCYAYTAGHVVQASRGPVTLVDRGAFTASAKVLRVDRRLDLALLEIPDGLRTHRQLCRAARAQLLQLDAALPVLRLGNPDIWLDRISSPAGGLDRFELAFAPSPPGADFVDLVPVQGRDARTRGRSIQDGYSGSSVYFSERDTERQRYAGAELSERHTGRLLGVLIESKDDLARVVRSDRLHEFVFDTLQPVRWDAIAFEPRHAKVVERRRGRFAGTRTPDLQLADGVLDHLSFELDLDERETLVEGVRIEFDAALATVPGRAGARPQPLQLAVSTSQYRPGDTQARWAADRCQPPPRERAKAGAATERVDCLLRSPRVARGVRVEVTGNPSALRRVSVIIGP